MRCGWVGVLVVLVGAAAARAQATSGQLPVRLKLELEPIDVATIRVHHRTHTLGGGTDSISAMYRGRAGLKLVLENTSPAPVVVPCARFAGNELVTLDFALTAAIVGLPQLLVGPTAPIAGGAFDVAAGSESPCGFQLVELAPGARTDLFPPDTSMCQVLFSAPVTSAKGQVEIQFSFKKPVNPAVPLTTDDPERSPRWKQVVPGPYTSTLADLEFSAKGEVAEEEEPPDERRGQINTAIQDMPSKGHLTGVHQRPAGGKP